MIRRAALACALVASFVLGTPVAAASGDFYRFVDSRGVVHFSDRSRGDDWTLVPGPRGTRRPGARRTPRRYDRLIARAAGRYGVPAAMVKAVIHAESSFDPGAISRAGAMGLMQLMPATARTLGVLTPFDAGENVFGGTRYLRELHDRYGSWSTTLAAYNAGPTAVERYEGIPPFAETQKYVQRVLSYYRRYHGDFPR